MDRQYILDEIKRTATLNGGSPLGMDRFYAETNIKRTDWLGKYWAKWSYALAEAGFAPNSFGRPEYDEDLLLNKLALFCREIRHFPVRAEADMKAHQGDFPRWSSTYRRHFGVTRNVLLRLTEYCARKGGYDDVLQMCTLADQQKEDTR